MPREFTVGRLAVHVLPTGPSMAEQAAKHVAKAFQDLGGNGPVNILFGGAESQIAFHRELANREDIDWARVHAFNVDDYWEPTMDRRFSVAACIETYLYGAVRPARIDGLNCCALDAERERARYEEVLRDHRLHIACIGVGESGHIGLNEPCQTSFEDSSLARIITLPEASRSQLQRDQFLGGTEIPHRGITTTIPKIMEARTVLAVVPFRNKAQVVRRLLTEPVSEACPATILRTHPNAHLYLDAESASLLVPGPS